MKDFTYLNIAKVCFTYNINRSNQPHLIEIVSITFRQHGYHTAK